MRARYAYRYKQISHVYKRKKKKPRKNAINTPSPNCLKLTIIRMEIIRMAFVAVRNHYLGGACLRWCAFAICALLECGWNYKSGTLLVYYANWIHSMTFSQSFTPCWLMSLAGLRLPLYAVPNVTIWQSLGRRELTGGRQAHTFIWK